MAPHILFPDTCALGKKYLVRAFRYGYVEADQVVILKSVSRESLKLGASPSSDKREASEQARLTLMELHSLPHVTLIMDKKRPTDAHVDDDLINRACATKGYILTEDTILQERAEERGIGVVRVQKLYDRLWYEREELDELFRATQHIDEGEILTVRIKKQGEEARQGIGYLPDGRVVVVSEGIDYLGTDVQVRVTHISRKQSGREAIFAVPDSPTTTMGLALSVALQRRNGNGT